jgi:predicted CoA-binding protein
MTTRAQIDDFLSYHNLALVRASRATQVRGVKIDEQLGPKGYVISVVYLDESNDPKLRLNALKTPVDGVIIAIPAAQSEKAVREAIDAKIPRVWLQPGSESKPVISLCEEKGISVIHGACIMMYAEPVKSFHAFHRGMWKVFGRYRKREKK